MVLHDSNTAHILVTHLSREIRMNFRVVGTFFAVVFLISPAWAGDWFAIEHLPDRCTNSDSNQPGAMIKNANLLGQKYITNDVTDPITGQIVETTIQFPAMDTQITYYRGADRCQSALDSKSAGEKAAADRYK